MKDFNLYISDNDADFKVRGTVDPGDPSTWQLHRSDPGRYDLEIGELHIHTMADWETAEQDALDLGPLLARPVHDRIHAATEERLRSVLRHARPLVEWAPE